MSATITTTIYCDDCKEPLDDGNVGTRSRSEARRLAKRKYGCKRLKMLDGQRYDICGECQETRGASRVPPRR